MVVRKTQSQVTVNAKLSSVNIQKVALLDGSLSFAEGAPVMINATTGGAALATDCSPLATTDNSVVFINWVDSDRSDVGFIQKDPTDSTAPTMSIEGGGLACIVGNMVDIGLPASSWEDGTLPTIGYGVFVTADGDKFDAESIQTGGCYYGRVWRHYNGRAHFIFHSVPMVYN